MEFNEKDSIVEITHGESKSHWKVVRKLFKVPEHIDEERRRDVDETEIVLAFPLNEDGSPNTSDEQFVFAFLPVRKYGFKFIIQADFLMPITREDIIADNEWNKWLRDSVLEVLLDAIEEFKKDEKIKYSFYTYLFCEEVKEEFFLPLVQQIYDRLKEEKCILTEANNWKRPSEVLIGNSEIQNIVSNEDLQKLLGKEYLSRNVKAKKSVLRRLGIKEFSLDNLIRCLENVEWVKTHDDDWFANLFRYLSKEKLSDEQLEQLKNLPIIKLENGDLTSINDGPVFRPLEDKIVYGFENELRVIKKNIIDIVSNYEKEDRDGVLVFLDKLGIKKANPYEIIENHILSVYENGEWREKPSQILVGYIRYIKDNIDKYERESDKRLNANKRSWEAKEDPLKRLKESLLIRIDKDGEKYAKPNTTYLPKIYRNDNDLEALFEGIEVNFVHPCYLELDEELRQIDKKLEELNGRLRGKSRRWMKKHKKEIARIKEQVKKLEGKRNEKIKEWKEFFLKLGVSEVPKVDYYKGRIMNYDKYPTYEEREYSTRGHSVEDWRLSKEFETLLEMLDLKKANILLAILDKNWSEVYSNCCMMEYNWFYRYDRYKKLPSSFIRELRERLRIPSTQNTLVKPSEVFLDKPEIRELLGDNVPYLAVNIENEQFIKAIGINSEANVNGVLNYLKTLIEQGIENKEKFEKLYRFLDDHFEENGNRIKKEFDMLPLIFVPSTEKKYYSSQEVIWMDVSNIFGKNRAYLEKHYPKLKKFFVEKLGISEKPKPEDYADVLRSISEKSRISEEDKSTILKIYEELNRNLDPDKVIEPISGEDWWGNFIKESIFFTDKGEFWFNEDNVFINDNSELYELFKDEDISFLWLPKGYHPSKIRFFIESCGLRYISECVDEKPLIEPSRCSKDEELTQFIQKVVPYIMRYLYWREYAAYEELKRNGIFEKIAQTKVYVTNDIKVEYLLSIGEWKKLRRVTQKNCILHNNRLYVAKGNNDIYQIATEFSKLFGGVKGLDDFLMNIMTNFEHVENIMKAKNIDELPHSELKPILDAFEVKEMEQKMGEETAIEVEKTSLDRSENLEEEVILSISAQTESLEGETYESITAEKLEELDSAHPTITEPPIEQERENMRPSQYTTKKQSNKKLMQTSKVTEDTDLSDRGSPTSAPRTNKTTKRRLIETPDSFVKRNEKIQEVNELYEILDALQKFTFRWFKTLNDLELAERELEWVGNPEFDIYFKKIERYSENSLILKYPSFPIPPYIEDLTGLPLSLYSREGQLDLTVDVTHVKDDKLIVKILSKDSIPSDLSTIIEAKLSVKNLNFLLEELKKYFERELKYTDDECLLCELYNKNIEFIFGPPGTGKTTELAKLILETVFKERTPKILILTPTNKAADVIVRKIVDMVDGTINPHKVGISDPKIVKFINSEFRRNMKDWVCRYGSSADRKIQDYGLVRTDFVYNPASPLIVTSTVVRLPYATCNQGMLKELDWDYVVVDEASMVPASYAIYTILCLRGNPKFIFAGDPFQIQPVGRTDEWKYNIYEIIGLTDFVKPETKHPDTGCENSEKEFNFKVRRLRIQYRSIVPIGELFSKYKYSGMLEHKRGEKPTFNLKIDEFEFKPVTLVKFKLGDDKLTKIHKFRGGEGSSYHPYSAILAVELAFRLARNFEDARFDNYEDVYIRKPIGILAPYRGQADIVSRIVGLSKYSHLIDVGTVHGFQGDENNVIITIFNPPSRNPNSSAHINNQNILNVAISRAKDYLIILAPEELMVDNQEVDTIYNIAKELTDAFTEVSSQYLEELMFGDKNYLKNATFVTSHQSVNAYSLSSGGFKYEIRVGDDNVDVVIFEPP
jgi:flagellar biosynthesis GTPase FlhF